MGTTKRGRPVGLLLNPAAFDHLLGQETQAELAARSRVSLSAIAELAIGARGASPATAGRLASALNCEAAVLFPELAKFTTTVRVFTASGAES